MTGMLVASMISRIMLGSDALAIPPSFLMSAGIRSSAITDTAPARSATRAFVGNGERESCLIYFVSTVYIRYYGTVGELQKSRLI